LIHGCVGPTPVAFGARCAVVTGAVQYFEHNRSRRLNQTMNKRDPAAICLNVFPKSRNWKSHVARFLFCCCTSERQKRRSLRLIHTAKDLSFSNRFMKKGFWLGAFILLWLPSLSGMASTLEDKVNALEEAMKEDPASSQPTSATLSDRPGDMRQAAQNQFLNQIASGQTGQLPGNDAAMMVNQILLTHSSEAVQKAGHELLDEMEADRRAKADAFAAEVTDVLKRLADTVAKSTKPSDLDQILVELQKYQRPGYPAVTEDQQRLFQQVAMAYQFATGWQDYLSSETNGNADQARNELRSLAQNGYGITIVPRSHLLDLMNAPINLPANPAVSASPVAPNPTVETVDAILDQVQTPNQMEGALKQLEALNFPPSSDESRTIQTLQSYVQCYNAIKAGVPTSLNLTNDAQTLSGHEAITREIWLMALQAMFPSFKGAVTPDEKPLDFVNRVIADAVTHQDWKVLKKALETKDTLTKSTQFGLYVSNPTSGLNPLISALNQEAAGQFSLAVVSYEETLKSPSLDIPAKMIGEKLAAIKRNHPGDFQTGYQQAASPPTPSPYFNMPWRPGMPGYPPGYPYPSRTPPNMTLSIPGQGNPAAASGNAATNQVSLPTTPVTNPTLVPATSGK
jgi:hypothetical protein